MEGLWVIAIIWAVMSIVGKAVRQTKGDTGTAPAPSGRKRVGHRPARRPRPATVDQPAGAPAPEDEWRREIERLLGVRTGAEYGPVGRRSREGLPEAEDAEDRGSLETEPEAVSLETLDERQPEPEADFDDQAQAVLDRRLAAAEARTSGRTMQDHRRFDQAIRQPLPAAPSHVPKRPSLRQALVWREILGPPVSLRGAGKDG